MATTIRHYNGKQKRVHFTTGKMGDELNRKTDSEYNIIKMSYESMHPDAAIMSFEEHVRLADEAGNQQNPAQGNGYGAGHGTSSRVGAETMRPSSGKSPTAKGSSTVGDSQRSNYGQSERSQRPSHLPQNNQSSGSSNDSASILLAKLGLDEPKEKSSETAKHDIPKSKLFKIAEDPDGYGLSTKFGTAAGASKRSSADDKSHRPKGGLPEIREESTSHAPSLRTHNRGPSSREPTSRTGLHGPPWLSHIQEESSRHGFPPSSSSTMNSPEWPNDGQMTGRLRDPSMSLRSHMQDLRRPMGGGMSMAATDLSYMSEESSRPRDRFGRPFGSRHQFPHGW